MQVNEIANVYTTDVLNSITSNRTSGFRNDLDEVFLLAEATPSLMHTLPQIYDVINWFYRVFNSNVNSNEMNGYWFDFVNMVLQRYAVLFDVELTAADKLVSNLFRRFFNSPQLNDIHMSYRHNAAPMVFLGRGGSRSYYILPPTLHRPLAIIHLPRAALNNVWRWTILAHETGHDVYFCVDNLAKESGALVSSVAVDALRAGITSYDPISVLLEINGRPTPIDMTQEQFTVLLWTRWTKEVFADLFAILLCGPATVYTLQEMVGFGSVGAWHGVHGPDTHPIPLIRNLINLEVLRELGFANHARVLEQRILSHSPVIKNVNWVFNGDTEVTRVDLNRLLPMINLVTKAMLNTPLQSLKNHSLREIITFTYQDQTVVDGLIDAIVTNHITPKGVEPRHMVSAAQLAFAYFPNHAENIHNRVMGMLTGSFEYH